MNDFSQTLNEEIEKREGSDLSGSARRKKKKFSWSTFVLGLGFIALVLGGLFTWAQFRASKTAETVQNRLPSKTAIVNVIGIETYRLGDAQQNQNRVTLLPLTDPNANLTPNEEEAAIKNEELEIINMINENREGPAPSSPFSIHRKAYTKTSKPSLSIVITNLGLSEERTKAIIQNLPEGITLALSPYSENLDSLITMAKNDGHEVWLMLPMETDQFPLVDSGPLTLLTDASLEQNTDRANQILNVATGHVGFIPNKNHVFVGEDGDINPAIKQLLEAGYGILDSNNSNLSFVTNLAYKNNYPYGQNNFWLDDNLTPLSMNQRLRELMELAEAKGSAIMLLNPYPISIKTLQRFLNSEPAQKFDLAPVSAYLKNAG